MNYGPNFGKLVAQSDRKNKRYKDWEGKNETVIIHR